jgi:hypothetical protein
MLYRRFDRRIIDRFNLWGFGSITPRRKQRWDCLDFLMNRDIGKVL